MSKIEIRKSTKTRSCFCRRGYGGRIRVCGHDRGVKETYWVILIDGQETGDRFPLRRDALEAIQKEKHGH